MQSGDQPCTVPLTSPVASFKVIDRGPTASLIIQDTSVLIFNSGFPQFWESGGRKPVISLDQAKTFESGEWGVGCGVRRRGSVSQPRSLAEMWQILQDCLEPWTRFGCDLGDNDNTVIIPHVFFQVDRAEHPQGPRSSQLSLQPPWAEPQSGTPEHLHPRLPAE